MTRDQHQLIHQSINEILDCAFDQDPIQSVKPFKTILAILKSVDKVEESVMLTFLMLNFLSTQLMTARLNDLFHLLGKVG